MTMTVQLADMLVCSAVVAVAVAGLLHRFVSKEPTTPCLVQRGGRGEDAPALVQIGRARPRRHA